MSPDDSLDRLRAAIRHDRTVAILLAAVVGLAIGLFIVFLLQSSTADQVKIVQRNSRCNGGDLAACRIVVENLRRACTPRILARVPAQRRARERRRCGLVRTALRSTTRIRRRASQGRSSSSSSPSSSARTPALSRPTPPVRRSPPERRTPSRPSSPTSSPPSTAPAPAPAGPSAPAQPAPLIDLPDVLPCVVQLQPVIGC